MNSLPEQQPLVPELTNEPKNLPALPAEAEHYEVEAVERQINQVPRPARKLIIMGATGAGKSTFINQAADSSLAVSNSLASCTRTIGIASMILEDGTPIELVDTPGFDDSIRTDIEILDEIATALKDWDDIYGIIYLHRISDFRISGAARKTFSACFNICGEKIMDWLTIVTNMWDKVSPELGESRENELRQKSEFFETAISSGATILRNDSPPTSAKEIVQKAIRERPVRLLVQHELRENGGDILSTTAGLLLDQEMAEKRAKHEAELAKISEEYARALQQQDDETQAELAEERAEIQKKIADMQAITGRIKAKQKPKPAHSSKPAEHTTTYGKPTHPSQAHPPSGSRNSRSRTVPETEAYERTNWQQNRSRDFDPTVAAGQFAAGDHTTRGDTAGKRFSARGMSKDEIKHELAKVKQEVMANYSGVHPQLPPTADIGPHDYYNTAETSQRNKRVTTRSSSTSHSRRPHSHEVYPSDYTQPEEQGSLLSMLWLPNWVKNRRDSDNVRTSPHDPWYT